MKSLLTSALAILTLTATLSLAQTLKISQEPTASLVNTNDDVLINATNNGLGTWTTKRATVSKLVAGALPMIQAAIPASSNGIALLNGHGTNTTLAAAVPRRQVQITDASAVGGNSNRLAMLFTADYNDAFIWFNGTNGGVADIMFQAMHDSAGPMPELLMDSSGSIAFNAHWIQVGVGTYMPTFLYMNSQLLQSDPDLGDSIPLLFTALYRTNSGDAWKHAGSRDAGFLPGFHFQAVDKVGNGSLGIYSKFNVPYNGTLPMTGNVKQHEFWVGPNPGFAFSGGLTNNGVAGITTNYTMPDGLTVLSIQNGIIVGLTSADTDVTSFFTRSGITDATQKQAIRNLVSELKSKDIWNKLDAVYPFVGGSSAAHAVNLVSTNFTITWSGTLTHDANGVTGNAVDGYGDTHYQPSVSQTTNSALVYVYQRLGNPLPTDVPSYGCFVGNYQLDRGWSYLGKYVVNESTITSCFMGPGSRSNATPWPQAAMSAGHSIAYRTNSTSIMWHRPYDFWYYDNTSGALSTDLCTNSITVLACNGVAAGAVGNFSGGNIAFVALGKGLDSKAQADDFIAAVTTFNTALSR